MSLKTLSKTRWKIESDRVVIYPYGVFYILTTVLAVIFAGLMIAYVVYLHNSVMDSLPLLIVTFLFVAAFWFFGSTYIEFDNRNAKMRKVIMGFLPTTSIPFADIQGINPVTNLAGSYNYRMFRKDQRYGKGIVVSSGYTKNDDPNAIAFVEQAVPVIHGYLDLHDRPADYIVEPITSYRFFNQSGTSFKVKNKKLGAIIFGLFFFGLGIWMLTVPADNVLSTLAITVFMVFLGLIFFNAAFTEVVFDRGNQKVTRKGLVKYFNKEYHFGAFEGIQTLRRSINFVYAGTDINMYFNLPEKPGKQDVMTVSSFRKSKNVERFITEVYQIMEI